MKKVNIISVLFLTILTVGLVGLHGCGSGGGGGGDAPADIASFTTEAKTALENREIAVANAKFQEAFNQASGDNDANFGLALTDLLLLVENQDVIDIIEAWDETAPLLEDILYDKEVAAASRQISATIVSQRSSAKLLFNDLTSIIDKLPTGKTSVSTKSKLIAAKIPLGAPTISRMQEVINNTVLPVIESSLSRIRVIQDKDYTFTVTPAMTNDSENMNTILDDGEFYIIDAALCGLKAALNVFTAYNLDVDYNTIEANPLGAFEKAGFLTLKAGGDAKMTTALSSIKEGDDKLEKAYNFLRTSDMDITSDNGLDFEDWSAEDFEIAEKVFDAADILLAGRVNVTLNRNNGTETLTLTNGVTTTIHTDESSGDDYSLNTAIDITKAFTNPLDETDLPEFKYDPVYDSVLSVANNEPMCRENNTLIVECELANIEASDFPDQTLNGIFPTGIPEDID